MKIERLVPSYCEDTRSEKEVNKFFDIPESVSKKQDAKTLPQKIIHNAKELIKSSMGEPDDLQQK